MEAATFREHESKVEKPIWKHEMTLVAFLEKTWDLTQGQISTSWPGAQDNRYPGIISVEQRF
ncbi:hypothetical protein HJFPF1_06403 [Paramyrothecium foliicola]|nr:hypothetical protein HJFPF1_06403 [Paramyrothecium foliicola]